RRPTPAVAPIDHRSTAFDVVRTAPRAAPRVFCPPARSLAWRSHCPRFEWRRAERGAALRAGPLEFAWVHPRQSPKAAPRVRGMRGPSRWVALRTPKTCAAQMPRGRVGRASTQLRRAEGQLALVTRRPHHPSETEPAWRSLPLARYAPPGTWH